MLDSGAAFSMAGIVLFRVRVWAILFLALVSCPILSFVVVVFVIVVVVVVVVVRLLPFFLLFFLLLLLAIKKT